MWQESRKALFLAVVEGSIFGGGKGESGGRIVRDGTDVRAFIAR
jgi:hypothetical protein